MTIHPFANASSLLTELHTADIPEVYQRFVDVVGAGNWAHRVAQMKAAMKHNRFLEAYLYGENEIAFGLDRSVTLMCEKWDSIRDVIAFPKTQRGQDLMVDAPSTVPEKQLRDLHIKLRGAAQNT